ncbi:MAG: cob(I)yrinic acid a,c-diamide adenosyltransferase [Devosia sp.]|jgi:cob(I)alamin adenosyltransferase|uniref:cob(I)yrinic acid a,c-diamide adenosyltransferase n=1 Tax=unclassified Devosia TaxID=196773 RepID=UPI0009270082|nr:MULTISPECIES: cob(I)yrinic acid a,c-diamide adenosyltransferase [unclassified Devosia]MBL8597396.1 cob(I)yrinic acid a,c-diamide adenosyltransferase [Devosia sp.]MBN9344708.1 cob(I)yrinic acid a,c-diamide adenosyltransferase [Devosia sp.]OJX48687.1 MAG: ATP:cob(I)alamin adenosyltransferase [Devosia sp. 66-22]
MVKLNKIYTKTGDDGTTGLVRGPRRLKYDLRVNCFGTVDEANGTIGVARLSTSSMPKIDAVLGRIQNDLFDLGSDLATPGADPAGTPASLRITAAQTQWLEQQIDQYNEGLAPLTSFVLPGGTPLAAALHVARTVTRRAERLVVELVLTEPGVNSEAMIYLNRLSDLLFVFARVANANGKNDVLWVPGRHTKASDAG